MSDIDRGGVWDLREFPAYWIRPLDGALVNVRTGRARMPARARGTGAPFHRLAGTSRTVASLLRGVDLSSPPAAYFPLAPRVGP